MPTIPFQNENALRRVVRALLAKDVAHDGAKGSKTFDFPSVASGASTSTTVTVTGARVGDRAGATMSVAVPGGAALTATVTANDTVTVTLLNLSGGAVDLASGTLTAVVHKLPS